MTIHREGFKTISIATLITISINFTFFFLLNSAMMWLSIMILVITIALLLFLVSFFRIPDRRYTLDDKSIIAPADGRVVVIEEITDPEYFKDRRIQGS